MRGIRTRKERERGGEREEERGGEGRGSKECTIGLGIFVVLFEPRNLFCA